MSKLVWVGGKLRCSGRFSESANIRICRWLTCDETAKLAMRWSASCELKNKSIIQAFFLTAWLCNKIETFQFYSCSECEPSFILMSKRIWKDSSLSLQNTELFLNYTYASIPIFQRRQQTPMNSLPMTWLQGCHCHFIKSRKIWKC